MASIVSSFNGMKAWVATVSGVSAAYTVDEFLKADAASTPVTTPCAVIDFDLEKQVGFQTMAFQGGAAKLEFMLCLHLLYSPVLDAADYPAQQMTALALVDTFYQALVANPMMIMANVPVTHYPFEGVKPIFKRTTIGRSEYHEVQFEFKVGINL